jgi:hypothetical protein
MQESAANRSAGLAEKTQDPSVFGAAAKSTNPWDNK